MRKEVKEIGTVGELKSWLSDIPDDMPIGRQTNGHYQVNRIGDVSFFVGSLPIGRNGVDGDQTILRICA